MRPDLLAGALGLATVLLASGFVGGVAYDRASLDPVLVHDGTGRMTSCVAPAGGWLDDVEVVP